MRRGVTGRARNVALGLACLWMGCAANAGQIPEPGSAIRERWVPGWVFGMFGRSEFDVRDLCSSGRARDLTLGTTWPTLGVSLLTLGVYTPHALRVRCRSAAAP